MAHTIYLVAEADAGSRETWPGPDRLRPITRDGWRQAREVAAELLSAHPRSIVASPWLRCRQTLMPLADALGLEVGEHRALAEAEPVETVMSLLAELGDTAVVCTHSDLVRQILSRARATSARTEIGPWVLELSA